jgi:hypothetical protein
MVEIAFPSKKTAPDEGVSFLARVFRRVDLPLPLAPMIAVIEPDASSRSKFFNTTSAE